MLQLSLSPQLKAAWPEPVMACEELHHRHSVTQQFVLNFPLEPLPVMSDTDPFVDWTADVDVNRLGKVTDTQALQKGWSNAKVAGAYIVCFLSVSALIWPIFTAYDDKRRKSEYYNHFN